MDLGLLDKFVQGLDIFLWPLLLLALSATFVVAERFYAVYFKYSTNAAKLMEKVQAHVIDNKIEQALNLCNASEHAALHQVFKAALLNADRSPREIQDHVEVASLGVIPKLQNRVGHIFTFANVATLIGLLGTIYGLVITFESIGNLDPSQQKAMLSAGISSAMYSTAAGLLIAIPCLLAFGAISNKINSLIDEIDHYGQRLVILLRTGSEYFEQFNPDAQVTTEKEIKDHVA